MKKLTLTLLVLSTAAFACGDKAKKKTTASSTEVEAPGPVETATPPAEISAEEKRLAALKDVVYFSFDSSDLDEASRAALEENAQWMKEDASRVLTIEGHTDEVGTTDYNLALGERRARVTKDYLVRMGVDGARIQIITYGEERPAGSEDSLNRRSVFVATRK